MTWFDIYSANVKSRERLFLIFEAFSECPTFNSVSPQMYMYILKLIYSEKATKFREISTVDLSYVVTVKSTVELSQNLLAFSEYMNFKLKIV